MASVKTASTYSPSVIGEARVFVAGLEYPRLTPRDTLAFQSITEVSGLTAERQDDTTYTLPSDTDGKRLNEKISATGALQQQSGTFTQYLDETSDEPWWAGFKKSVPGTLWVPMGANRSLQDKDSWTSGRLVDKFTIASSGVDDSINPSDGDVSNPLKTTANFNFHGRNFHIIRGADFIDVTTGTRPAASTSLGGNDTSPVIASDVYENDNGRHWFLLSNYRAAVTAVGTQGSEATAQAVAHPRIIARDGFGNWRTPVALESSGTDAYADLKVIGDNILVLNHGGSEHKVISIADVLSNTPENITDVSGYGGNPPRAIYARSAGEIIVVGDSGQVYNLTSIRSAPVVNTAASALTTSDYHAIHGAGDQVVVVGAAGEVIVSENFGESWVERTEPSGTGSVILNTVFMIDKDMFFVGAANGDLFYTIDFGLTFTEITLPVSLATINDIQFLWPDGADEASAVGYLVGRSSSASTGGVVLRTIDRGNTWSNASNYIAGTPTITGDNPNGTNLQASWNTVTVADAQSVIIGGSGLPSGTINNTANATGEAALVEYE